MSPSADRASANHRTPRLRRPRRAGASALPVALLAGALALAAVLAYQAADAARSHQAAAERALRDYAAFAAEELSRRTQSTLDAATITAQYLPISISMGALAGQPLPSAAAYGDTVRAQDYWCECLAGVRDFFRVDLPSGAADWAGALPAMVRRDVERRVVAHAATLDRKPGDYVTNLYGEAERATSSGSYQMRVGQSTAEVTTAGGRPLLLIYTVIFGDGNRVRGVYGLAAEPGAVIAPVAERVLARRPLLPPSLTGGLPNDSLLAAHFDVPGGATVFRRGGRFDARYAAADTFAGTYAGVSAHVALRPGVAERLLIGGVPRSRLPVVLGVLALTAGLVVVALLQVRRQNELARLRADFVSGVSHELRTPLTQIRMFAELLAGGRLRTEEERQRSVRLIDQEARRLSYLVENVLDFSRVERGATRISPEPTDLAAAVREVADGFAPIARSRGASLRIELEEGIGIDVDRGALRQVLLNFLDNAVKYGPSGQTVTVSATRSGAAARVSVEDQGPGVPAKERRRIWEPYVRLDRETERVAGGSGIGLSVARDLVRLHGGAAWVEDGDGGGARFVAELPLRSSADPTAVSDDGGSAGGSRSTDNTSSDDEPAVAAGGRA